MSYLTDLARRALDGDGVSSPLGMVAKEVELGTLINLLEPMTPADIEDPGNGGAIPVDHSGTVRLVTTGAETRTVADPEAPGLRLGLYFQTDGGNCVITFASNFDAATNNVVTHDTAGEIVVFESHYTAADTLKWRLVANPESTPVS